MRRFASLNKGGVFEQILDGFFAFIRKIPRANTSKAVRQNRPLSFTGFTPSGAVPEVPAISVHIKHMNFFTHVYAHLGSPCSSSLHLSVFNPPHSNHLVNILNLKIIPSQEIVDVGASCWEFPLKSLVCSLKVLVGFLKLFGSVLHSPLVTSSVSSKRMSFNIHSCLLCHLLEHCVSPTGSSRVHCGS